MEWCSWCPSTIDPLFIMINAIKRRSRRAVHQYSMASLNTFFDSKRMNPYISKLLLTQKNNLLLIYSPLFLMTMSINAM
jgi:hypothetical protein